LKFINQNLELGPKRKVVLFENIYQHAKFEEFGPFGRLCFVFSNLELGS
jgi:hypothetical protein